MTTNLKGEGGDLLVTMSIGCISYVNYLEIYGRVSQCFQS